MYALKDCNLFILCSAQIAENAEIPRFGYAAVTRSLEFRVNPTIPIST